MTYAVAFRDINAQPIAAVRCTATQETLGQTIQEALGEVWDHLRRSPPGATGRNVVLYLDDALTLDIGVEIQPPFTASESVRPSATPSGPVATTVHYGAYQRLPEAHRAIREQCAREQRALAGPSWEVYGHWTDDPSQLTTEVVYLLDESEEPGAA
ncbi:MAG: GyrI-like domain-containing protein [Anaerolineae bacterium]|nr:GyrI-like domain-containing protein [Anaerolineae bacterium]